MLTTLGQEQLSGWRMEPMPSNWHCGRQPLDEVITVSHTAVATVAAIESQVQYPCWLISNQHYSPNPLQLADVLSERTRAIIVVHLYGQAADLDQSKSSARSIIWL